MTVIRSPIRPVIFSPIRAPTALYKGGGQWSPLNLVQPGDILLWYDPSDLATLFQDTAGTTPVTTDGQSIALMRDKGPGGYHRTQASGPSMPKWKTAAGLSRFLYDGSDDSNKTSAINWGTDKATIIAGVTKSTDFAYQMLVEFSASVATNNGSFSVLTTSGQGVALPNAFSFGLRGSAFAGYDATVYAAGSKYVVAVRLDIAGAAVADEVKPQINGAVPGTLTSTGAANAGTGNFGNHVLNFGRRNNASLPLNGSEHQFIAINRLLSDAEFLRAVGFVAEKTGITL